MGSKNKIVTALGFSIIIFAITGCDNEFEQLELGISQSRSHNSSPNAARDDRPEGSKVKQAMRTTDIAKIEAHSMHLTKVSALNAAPISPSIPTVNKKKPDFSRIRDVHAKKIAFFDYLYNYIEIVNLEVVQRKDRIIDISHKKDSELADDDKAFIEQMSEMYLKDHDASDTIATANYLIPYVDIVPSSLALAQAANESGWGTSRFAVNANNYYGQWCFNKGCGLVPKKRNDGAAHEVRQFKTPQGSVRSYVRNINTHRAYKDIRKMRKEMRKNQQWPSGADLAKGLSRYSQRKGAYVKEIQTLIRRNHLDKYDEKMRETIRQYRLKKGFNIVTL